MKLFGLLLIAASLFTLYLALTGKYQDYLSKASVSNNPNNILSPLEPLQPLIAL